MKETVLADWGQAPHWSFRAHFYDSPMGNQSWWSGTFPISIISGCESSLMFLSTSEKDKLSSEQTKGNKTDQEEN